MPGVADNAIRTSETLPSSMHAMNVRLNVRSLCASSMTQVPHSWAKTVCALMVASIVGAFTGIGEAHLDFNCVHRCDASFSTA